MLSTSIVQGTGKEGTQGGNIGALGVIMEGLECQVKRCGFY